MVLQVVVVLERAAFEDPGLTKDEHGSSSSYDVVGDPDSKLGPFDDAASSVAD